MSRHDRLLRAARGLVLAVVVVGLLGTLLWYCDRWARGQVEERASAILQADLGTPTAPSVDITGFSFLAQAVTGELAEVHVVAEDVGTLAEGALVVDHLDLTLHQVSSTDWFTTMNASTVDGRADLNLDAVRRLTGLNLSSAGGDRVALQVSTAVLGATVNATLIGRLSFDATAQTVSLTEPKLTIAGVQVPSAAARLIVRAVLKPVPVTGVPYGLRVPFLQLSEDGLTAGLAGHDVALSR